MPRHRLATTAELAAVLGLPVAVFVALQSVATGLIARQILAWSVNVLAMLLIWGALRRRRLGWGNLGLRAGPVTPRRAARALGTALVVLVVALAAFVVGSVVGGMLVGVPETGGAGTYDYLHGNLPMLLAALSGAWVASSFGEEVIYRGFLITRLEEIVPGRAATATAVLLAGLVFGAAHYGWGAIGVIQTAFMGWALAAAWIRVGRNLWITILAHAVMDTILLVQQYFSA